MIIRGNALSLPLASESVQCSVTSPPYWGLRKYAGEQRLIWGGNVGCDHNWQSRGNRPSHPDRSTGGKDNNGSGVFVQERGQQGSKVARGAPAPLGDTCSHCGAWRGAYGLEPTVEMYVEHSVQILREVRRVLRKDGVCFWNLADSYNAAGRTGHGTRQGYKQGTNRASATGADGCRPSEDSLKPKDLCLIPFRVALAAQADGWWVRSVIIWAKPNPMPESVRDRPTDAYEHVLMLTKSERYFWDAEAVKEASNGSENRASFRGNGSYTQGRSFYNSTPVRPDDTGIRGELSTSRNLRNVWTFPTQPYPEAHFATFPEELPRRCIKAATSERGACRLCGAPWERVTRASGGTIGKSWHNHENDLEIGRRGGDDGHNIAAQLYSTYRVDSLGWRPSCRCKVQHGKTAPCVVLDPFGGSGTTARVALELNRRPISVDLAYQELARKRTKNVQRQLLSVSP